MKKRRILFFALLLCLLCLPVHAANNHLQISTPSTVVDNEFLLRIRLKDAAWNDASASSVALRVSYNSEELEFVQAAGGLGAPTVEKKTNELIIRDSGTAGIYTLRLIFKALKVSVSNVSVTEAVIRDAAGEAVDCDLCSTAIAVLQSGDETGLFELTTAPAGLSPAFSPEITHYELTVPADTVGVQVYARPQGYYATAYVEGHWDLREGHNLITVDMTSGGGISALYTIDVTKSAPVQATATPAPTAIPTAAPAAVITPAPTQEPGATPQPTAVVIPTAEPEPTPAPTPVPTPVPTAEPVIQDSPETLQELATAKEELETVRQDAEAMSRAVKTAIVVCVGQFLVIVVLVVYIWNNLWGRKKSLFEREDSNG